MSVANRVRSAREGGRGHSVVGRGVLFLGVSCVIQEQYLRSTIFTPINGLRRQHEHSTLLIDVSLLRVVAVSGER